jgi:hypothetical protein
LTFVFDFMVRVDMKRDHVLDALVLCCLVGLAVAVRLMTETPNFGAVAAAALFAGFYFRSRLTALFVPLTAVVLSDQFLGGYERLIMLAVYAAGLAPVAFGWLLKSRFSVARLATAAVGGSLLFYLVTNAAVWYVWYPHSWGGLAHCYVVAVPFFKYTLASDLVFAGGFFGLHALATRMLVSETTAPEVIGYAAN